jgi:non-specific serine/threonine protein kinase
LYVPFFEEQAGGLGMIAKAWEAGFKDAGCARKDPELALLHGEPEFERMYPAPR